MTAVRTLNNDTLPECKAKVKLDTGVSMCEFELCEMKEALFVPLRIWLSVEFKDEKGIMMVLSNIQYKDAV